MKLKDKKIEILAVTIVTDPAGFGTEVLTPVAPPLWAYFRQLSGDEVYANEARFATEQVLFQIGYREGLTTRHVVRFRGTLYDITRIDVFEGYKSDLVLYCKLRSGK